MKNYLQYTDIFTFINRKELNAKKYLSELKDAGFLGVKCKF